MFLTCAAVGLAETADAQDHIFGQMLNLHAHGAWPWFEDEHAILDPLRGRLLVGSCGDASGVSGSTSNGDIDLAWLDIASGRIGAIVLHDNLEADDHNSAALFLRPDGRYLAMYGMHDRGSGIENRRSRYRISTAPGDPNVWTAEGSYLHPNAMSYSSLFHLTDTGRTYNFVRAINWDPNVMVSTDLGASWTGGGKMLTYGGSSDRPYVKYASHSRDRIDRITTEPHPRNLDTSIYTATCRTTGSSLARGRCATSAAPRRQRHLAHDRDDRLRCRHAQRRHSHAPPLDDRHPRRRPGTAARIVPSTRQRQ
ncbi:MAG: BNR-4 repeat-containing protein [Planctomycetota bacterium]